MSDRIDIECERLSTDHALLWYESRKKWRVTAINRTDSDLFLSWDESFTNPITGELWVEEVDQSPEAGERFVVEMQNVECTSFRASGSDEHRIAGTKFLQMRVPAGSTGSWIMERKSRSRDNWDGFSIYESDLVTSLEEQKGPPTPVTVVQPKIKGWFWA